MSLAGSSGAAECRVPCMEAFDYDPDLAEEDALLFGDDVAPPRAAVPPRRSSALSPRLQEAARLAAAASDESVERTEPLFVADDGDPVRVQDPADDARASREAPRSSTTDARISTNARAWSRRSVGAAVLLALVGAVAAVVTGVGDGDGHRMADTTVPAPVERVVTRTITVREPAPRPAATPKTARRPTVRRRAPRARPVTPPVATRQLRAPRFPRVTVSPSRRVYRAPARAVSADAAFGVRIP